MVQPRCSLHTIATDPAMCALTRDTELFCHVRNWPTPSEHAFDHQQPSPNVQSCITVTHETSCACEDFEQLHLPRRSHLFTSPRLSPTSLPGTPSRANPGGVEGR